MLQPNLLQNLSDAVSNGRSRCQRKVDDTEWNSHSSGCFLSYQLTNTGNLKCSFLNRLTKYLKIFSTNLGKGLLYNTRATDTHIDDSISLSYSMESTCHERVIIWCIAENNQFCTAKRIILLRHFCSFFYNFTHQTDCIHINTGLGGTHIDRTADTFRRCQRLRDGTHEKLVTLRHSLGNQCRKPAQEVNAYRMGCLIQHLCNLHIIIRCLAGRSTDQSNRSYGNTFINNGNSVLRLDGFSSGYQIFGRRGDLLINIFLQSLKVRINAVQKANAQRNGTYIQILFLDHFIGLKNFCNIDHSLLISP